nr:hypothetical protein [Dyella sp. ASV24]
MSRAIALAAVFVTTALSLASPAATTPATPNGASGVYDIQPRNDHSVELPHRKLYLAFEGDDVTGYYDNAYPQPADADVDDTCRFFLSGKQTAPATVTLSADYPGDGVASDIVLSKRPDGAWLVTVKGTHADASRLPNCSVPSLISGDVVKLASARPWRIVGRASKPTVPLYSEPSTDKKTKGYLVDLDPVAIQTIQGEWTQIDYLAKDHELVRWVKSTDVYYYLER